MNTAVKVSLTNDGKERSLTGFFGMFKRNQCLQIADTRRENELTSLSYQFEAGYFVHQQV